MMQDIVDMVKKKKRVGNEGFQYMDLRKIQEIMNTMFSCVV